MKLMKRGRGKMIGIGVGVCDSTAIKRIQPNRGRNQLNLLFKKEEKKRRLVLTLLKLLE